MVEYPKGSNMPRKKPSLLSICVILLCANVTAQSPAQDQAARGEKLYLSQCSFCHGQTGEGGRGSPLNRPRLRHAPDDEALLRVIRRGIADTAMPSSWMTENEAQLVAAHIRKLGRVSTFATPGNPLKGEQLFRSTGGCTRCHTVQGSGGAFGPDLTTIGERRSSTHLRESLVNPNADISSGYFEIRATTKEGRAIEGVRVNEDTFSIQLRDAGGKLHSLWKADLKSLDKNLKNSLMPSYGKSFTPAELDDLVAYLAKLTEDSSQ